MTQRERVLAMLTAAGPEGVTTATFLEARIPRFSARVIELREQGHMIITHRLGPGRFLYVLTRIAPAVLGAALQPSRPAPPDRAGRSSSLAHDAPGSVAPSTAQTQLLPPTFDEICPPVRSAIHNDRAA